MEDDAYSRHFPRRLRPGGDEVRAASARPTRIRAPLTGSPRREGDATGGTRPARGATHVLLYALVGELTRREAALLPRDSWSISAIVIWEIGKLAELGRIEGRSQ